jgi:hypothetical protein
MSPISIDRNVFLLIGIIALVLLLAALGLFLIQDTSAPLPWEEPTQTASVTPRPPTATQTSTSTVTSTPTRRSSYTPRALVTGTAVTGTPATPTLSTTPLETSLASVTATSASTALATSTATSASTAQATSTATSASTVQPTTSSTPTVTEQPTVTPTPTETTEGQTPQPSNTPTVTPENSSTPTETNTPTETSVALTLTPSPTTDSNAITFSGRIMVDESPAAGVFLTLENDLTDNLEATTGADGRYTFVINSTDSTYFTLVFDQTENNQLYPASSTLAWMWLEGVVPAGGLSLTLPDVDISLTIGSNTFGQTSPASGASFSLNEISSNPLRFEWGGYPGASQYWVDSGQEGSTNTVWQSNYTSNTFVSFDGKVGGSPIATGNYWWTVGAQKQIDVYTLWVYTPQRSIIFTP